MRLAAICDTDTGVGLRLAGVHEIYIPDANPLKTLDTIAERDDIGIIFITERYVQEMSKELKEFRLQNNIPVVVEIPDKNGRLPDHIDFVSHLIKRAVGIDISKKEK